MQDYIAEISAIDSNSWILMMMMCSLGCLIIKILIDSTAFSFISYPVLIYCSLITNNFLRKNEIAPGFEKASAVAFATGIGMTVGIVAMIALYFSLGALYQPAPPKRLDLPRSSRTAIE
jgi:hypothetical protein